MSDGKLEYKIIKDKFLRPTRPKRGKRAKNKSKFKKKFFDYAEAEYYIRQEGLQSVGDYDLWYALNKPARFPRYPDKYYREKGWQGWPKFLNITRNPDDYFKVKKFRPYDEACAYAQTLNLGSQYDWLEYIKTAKIPEDVPRRPDLYYNKTGDWISWRNFLGYTPFEKVERFSKAKLIMYVCQLPNRPTNVFKIGITSGGVSSVRDAINKYRIRVVRMYYVNEDYDWRTPIYQMGYEYGHGVEDEYALYNVASLYSHFDGLLEQAKPSDQ